MGTNNWHDKMLPLNVINVETGINLLLSCQNLQDHSRYENLLTIIPCSFLSFQQCCKPYVILWHNSIQHVI